MSEGRKASSSHGDEEINSDGDQFDCFGPEMRNKVQTGAEYVKLCMRLLEREWARREAVMEEAGWTSAGDCSVCLIHVCLVFVLVSTFCFLASQMRDQCLNQIEIKCCNQERK